MKSLILFLILLFSLQMVTAQVIDWKNTPRNPIGYKHTKNHFQLKGDIYASSGKIFDRNGNLTFNYGTRYYYDTNGKITGNNYDDSIVYDSRGNITSFAYKNGSKNTYRFNIKNLLIYEENTYDEDKTHTYDKKNRVVKTVINRKNSFHQARDYSYENKGNALIVTVQYTKSDNTPGFRGTYYYEDGFMIKEQIASGNYEYVFEKDRQGNKINFYSANDPKAKKFPTYNRYYSALNTPVNLEYGYYVTGYSKDEKKLATVFIDGKRASDIVISKGVKPNEKIIYDGLSKTYYSVENIVEENHTVNTRIPVTTVISKEQPHISRSYDGKFINYVHGKNTAKAREFAFAGPHMIDYRVEKNIGRTYVVDNYKNIKGQAVKPMRLLSADKTSIFYLREREKDNFFILDKGKHIDYKNARFEYLENGDPVIYINDVPLYVLSGFKNAQTNDIKFGKPYSNEIEEELIEVIEKETAKVKQKIADSKTDFNCVKGDCKEGWGRVKVNDIVTDATFKNSAINGVAYISYPKGSYYHGQYVDNRRDGFGYYKWATGNVYIGQWKDGKQHGFGYTMNDKNQIVSGGKFENGKLITDLTTDYRNVKSSGNCVGNCTNGFGKLTYSNGDRYWGFFKNGQRADVGSYYWTNKSSFIGSYTTNGKRNGYGMFTYVDGSVFKGIFKEDKIDGLGTMKYATSGNSVEGYFNNKGAKIKDY